MPSIPRCSLLGDNDIGIGLASPAGVLGINVRFGSIGEQTHLYFDSGVFVKPVAGEAGSCAGGAVEGGCAISSGAGACAGGIAHNCRPI